MRNLSRDSSLADWLMLPCSSAVGGNPCNAKPLLGLWARCLVLKNTMVLPLLKERLHRVTSTASLLPMRVPYTCARTASAKTICHQHAAVLEQVPDLICTILEVGNPCSTDVQCNQSGMSKWLLLNTKSLLMLILPGFWSHSVSRRSSSSSSQPNKGLEGHDSRTKKQQKPAQA